MANDMKRVGVELTAQGAKEFRTSLKECTAAMKENYSELKLAQSQYDKNTTSMKKLEDRQKYLAKQTDIYKDKVRILDGQLKEMENAEKRDETAIAKKRAELNQANAKLNEYEKSLGEVNKQLSSNADKMKEWGGQLQSIGGGIKTVGDNMTKYVTTPIVAGAGASVVAWKEVDAAMDTLVKKTGAHGKSLKDMKQSVREIATEIPTDFETAASAVGEVNTRYDVHGQKLKELSIQYIKFAELQNTDVTSAVDSTQKALAAWGLGANDAGRFLDRLNLVSQQTGVSSDKLASGLVTNSAVFKEMNLNIDQSATLMGQLEKSGVNSETALGGLRRALKNATADGTPLNVALQDLQNTIMNGTGSMDGLTASYELFGKNGDQIYNAVRNGAIDFSTLATSVEDAGGSVKQTFEETKDPMDDLKMLMNDLKLIGTDIVTTAAPMLKEVFTQLRDIVKDLAEKWNGLDEDQKEFILKAALVVAAIGPVLSIIGTVITTIGSLMLILGGLGVGLAPFLIGGAIIAGLIAAVVLIIANWEKVKTAVLNVGEKIKEAWTSLKTSCTQLATDAKKAWDGMKTGIANAASSIVSGAKSKFESLKTNITNIFEAAKKTVMSVFNAIKTDIQTKIDAIKGMAKFVWNLPKLGIKAVTSIPDKVEEIVEKIKKLFNFKISLPNIKLPHIRYHWKQIGDILKIPVFDGVDWYARAYSKAAYYDSPAVRADGRGFGDRQGGEFAVGERHLRDVIRGELANKDDHTTEVSINITINGTQGQDVKELAAAVSERLRRDFERERLVWA